MALALAQPGLMAAAGQGVAKGRCSQVSINSPAQNARARGGSRCGTGRCTKRQPCRAWRARGSTAAGTRHRDGGNRPPVRFLTCPASPSETQRNGTKPAWTGGASQLARRARALAQARRFTALELPALRESRRCRALRASVQPSHPDALGKRLDKALPHGRRGQERLGRHHRRRRHWSTGHLRGVVCSSRHSTTRWARDCAVCGARLHQPSQSSSQLPCW